MAKIKLSESTGGGYITKEEKNALLKITHAEYDMDFGKVKINLVNERGESMQNNFNLLNSDGTNNDGALKAFSYFARVAVGDWDRDDVEDTEMIGRFIRGDISVREGENKNKNGETMKFANLDKVYMTQDEFTSSKAAQGAEEETEVEDDEDDFDWD